ncbi:hypothetical protein BD408DRAFT_419997, partial [Parasitella parasitica]
RINRIPMAYQRVISMTHNACNYSFDSEGWNGERRASLFLVACENMLRMFFAAIISRFQIILYKRFL